MFVAIAMAAMVTCSNDSSEPTEQSGSDVTPAPTRTPIPTPAGDSDTPRPADDDLNKTPVDPTDQRSDVGGSVGDPSTPMPTPTSTPSSGGSGTGIAVGEPSLVFSPVSLPTRQITFNLTAPADTPATDPVFLTIMDLASGVSERFRMKNLGGGVYETQADVLDSAMIRYTYDRFEYVDICCLDEVTRESLGENFRLQYRFMLTADVDRINDSTPMWADLRTTYEEGEISGFVFDSESGEPVFDADVSISGVHVGTRIDGSFKVTRLPAGEHAIVVHSDTGEFNSVQQIVNLASGGTATADFTVESADLVPVSFDVRLPDTTPSDAWVKLAGNIHSLGGRIGNPSRPLSPDNYFIPRLERDGDQASTTLMLPAGAFIEYFYTIGPIGVVDETAEQGRRVRRSFVVGEDGSQRSDNVQNWANEGWPLVTLRLVPPAGTPRDAAIAIVMGPSSWMEPAGDGTYTTVLGSRPPGGTISYNYRLGDDFSGADASAEATDGMRSLAVPEKSGEIVDVVSNWIGQRDPTALREDGSLAVDFRVSVPPETPLDAQIFLVGDRPALGDGVELKPLAGNPWIYEVEVVFGHDGLLNFSYELRSEGVTTSTRRIETGFDGQVVNDWIGSWSGIANSVEPRDGFVKGYYTPDFYSNSFIASSESTYKRLLAHEGSAVVVSSVWSYGQSQPIPTLEYRGVHAGSVATPLEDAIFQSRIAHEAGLEVFFGPQFNMEQAPGGFEVYNGPKSDEWWIEWLKLADEMWTWQATVAEMVEAEYMMVPGPLFHVYEHIDKPSDDPFIVNFEAEQARLMAKIRAIYSGKLIVTGGNKNYDFPGLADFNGVTTYDVGVPDLPAATTVAEFVDYYEAQFVERVDTIFEKWGNPVFFYTIHAPSVPTADDPSGEIAQANAYEAIFQVIAKRAFINGSLTWSYDMIDAPLILSDGVRGRLAEAVLAKWYAILGGNG